MKSLKDTLTQKRAMSLSEKELLADKIHEAPILTSSQVENADKTAKALHRLTLDLPIWLIEKMKAETERNGQTMKGLILTMLLDKFKD